jgi:hypothetical protein
VIFSHTQKTQRSACTSAFSFGFVPPPLSKAAFAAPKNRQCKNTRQTGWQATHGFVPQPFPCTVPCSARNGSQHALCALLPTQPTLKEAAFPFLI